MIRKLRIKFIVIALSASLVILFGILGSINIANAVNVAVEGDKIMVLLLRNDGSFYKKKDSNASTNPPFDNENGQPSNNSSPTLDTPPDGFSQETPFSTRFFTVTFKTDGEITVSTDKIVSYSDEDAVALATELKESGKTKGYYNDYLYESKVTDDGSTLYVFIDRQNERKNARTFFIYSLLGALGGFALFAILIIIGSYFALKPAIESEKKQKMFITDSSHSLKTPLAIIQADNEVIEAENGSSQWTTSISSQVNHMSELVNKMVFLSRLDEGQKAKDRSQIDAAALLKEAAGDFESVFLQKHIEFSVNVKDSLPIFIDQKTLYELFNIFLENASKYTPQNGWMKVMAYRKGKQAIITFSNNIDYAFEGDANKLFDRFYRIDASRNSKTGGTGLGLSIAQAIVANEKGKLKATIVSNESILFEIKLNLSN